MSTPQNGFLVLTDISASFQSLDGFQSNPYRSVRLN